MSFLDTISQRLGFTGDDEEETTAEMDEELESGDDSQEEEGPSFFDRFRRRGKASFSPADDEEEPAAVQQVQNRAPSNLTQLNIQQTKPHCERVINVRQIDECREIIQYLLNGDSVLLNIENADPKDCGRIVDLLSGAAYALSGRMIKIAHLSYLLAPSSVEVVEPPVYPQSQVRYR